MAGDARQPLPAAGPGRRRILGRLARTEPMTPLTRRRTAHTLPLRRGRAALLTRSLAAAVLALGATAPLAAQTPEIITVDATAPGRPFPHFWERMFGSGRAVLSLRASYRDDLRAVRGITALSYVRFHDILDDDIGVYT